MYATEVHKAAARGDVQALQAALQAHPEHVNSKDGGNTPRFAVTPAEQALDGCTPLALAAAKGHVACVAALLVAGADVQARGTLVGHMRHTQTALHAAAANGQELCLCTLLEAGAVVDAVDSHGATALHLAASQGHLHCLIALLAAGAAANAADIYGLTALHRAASYGQEQCLQALLAAGAAVHAADADDSTALHLAASKGHVHCLRTLLAAGADAHATSASGYTATQLAAVHGHVSCVAALKAAGALSSTFIMSPYWMGSKQAKGVAQLTASDVDSLRPGRPLSSGVLQLFFSRLLPELLGRELGGDLSVLSRCRVVCTPEDLPKEGQPLPDYLMFPLVGGQPAHAHPASLLLACAPGKVLLHLDSQLGAVVGPTEHAMCLRGHLPHSWGGSQAQGSSQLQGGSQAQGSSQLQGGSQPQGEAEDVVGKRCEHAGCTKQSCCGLPGQQSTHCRDHTAKGGLLQAPLAAAEQLAAGVRHPMSGLGGVYAGITSWPLKSVKVPLQRQPGDGALFMCTNALFLLAGLPPALSPVAVEVLQQYRRAEIDLFQGTEYCYPGFLTRQWYPPEAAEALRKELVKAAQLEVQQVSAAQQEVRQAGGSGELVSQLAAVEAELHSASSRPFELPSQRLLRQQQKKRQRLLRAPRHQRQPRARWLALAEPLAVEPPAAEKAVQAALHRLQQQLLGPADSRRHTQQAQLQAQQAEEEQQQEQVRLQSEAAEEAAPAAAAAVAAPAGQLPAGRGEGAESGGVGARRRGLPQRASSRGVAEVVRQERAELEEEEEASVIDLCDLRGDSDSDFEAGSGECGEGATSKLSWQFRWAAPSVKAGAAVPAVQGTEHPPGRRAASPLSALQTATEAGGTQPTLAQPEAAAAAAAADSAVEVKKSMEAEERLDAEKVARTAAGTVGAVAAAGAASLGEAEAGAAAAAVGAAASEAAAVAEGGAAAQAKAAAEGKAAAEVAFAAADADAAAATTAPLLTASQPDPWLLPATQESQHDLFLPAYSYAAIQRSPADVVDLTADEGPAGEPHDPAFVQHPSTQPAGTHMASHRPATTQQPASTQLGHTQLASPLNSTGSAGGVLQGAPAQQASAPAAAPAAGGVGSAEKRQARKRAAQADADVGGMGDEARQAAKVPRQLGVCNKCGASMARLKRCSACMQAWYCSKQCQVADWARHKEDCSRLRAQLAQQQSQPQQAQQQQQRESGGATPADSLASCGSLGSSGGPAPATAQHAVSTAATHLPAAVSSAVSSKHGLASTSFPGAAGIAPIGLAPTGCLAASGGTAGALDGPTGRAAAAAAAAGAGAAPAGSSGSRTYSKWEPNGRGGFSKMLSTSDLLKLRLKGGALAAHMGDGDQDVQVVLASDCGSDGSMGSGGTAGASGGKRSSWLVGLWRPKSGQEAKQQLLSLQAGWPAVVSDLRLATGDSVELQPDGREPQSDDKQGSTRPRLLLTVRRAEGRASVQLHPSGSLAAARAPLAAAPVAAVLAARAPAPTALAGALAPVGGIAAAVATARAHAAAGAVAARDAAGTAGTAGGTAVAAAARPGASPPRPVPLLHAVLQRQAAIAAAAAAAGSSPSEGSLPAPFAASHRSGARPKAGKMSAPAVGAGNRALAPATIVAAQGASGAERGGGGQGQPPSAKRPRMSTSPQLHGTARQLPPSKPNA